MHVSCVTGCRRVSCLASHCDSKIQSSHGLSNQHYMSHMSKAGSKNCRTHTCLGRDKAGRRDLHVLGLPCCGTHTAIFGTPARLPISSAPFSLQGQLSAQPTMLSAARLSTHRPRSSPEGPTPLLKAAEARNHSRSQPTAHNSRPGWLRHPHGGGAPCWGGSRLSWDLARGRARAAQSAPVPSGKPR